MKQLQAQTQLEKEPIKATTDSVLSILSDRPPNIMRSVNSAFNDVSSNTMEIFNIQGRYGGYTIAGMYTEDVVLNMLRDYSGKGKTSFTFLDIGAGYHACAKELAKAINKHKDSFPNIESVHLVSLSGDKAGISEEENGICKVSTISKFKVEELSRWLNPSDEFIEAYEKVIAYKEYFQKIELKLDELKKYLHDFQDSPKIIYEAMATGNISNENNSHEINNILKELEEIRSTLPKELQEEFNLIFDYDFPSNEEEEILGDKAHTELQSALNEFYQESRKNLDTLTAKFNLNLKLEKEIELLKNIKALNLPTQFDYTTSSWCFRHLVDPMGTFIQAYNMLTPGSGVLHADGFTFQTELAKKEIPSFNILELIHNTKEPYIFDMQDTGTRRLFGYMLQRTSDKPLSLDFDYLRTSYITERYGSRSSTLTRINTGDSWIPLNKILGKFNIEMTDYATENLTLNHSPLEKYDNTFGGEDKLYRGLHVSSARGALINMNLIYKGLAPGGTKVTSEQLSALKEFIEMQYPDILKSKAYPNEPHKELIKEYRMFRTIDLGNIHDISTLMRTEPDLFNHNSLAYAIETQDVKVINLVLSHLKEKNYLGIENILRDHVSSKLDSYKTEEKELKFLIETFPEIAKDYLNEILNKEKIWSTQLPFIKMMFTKYNMQIKPEHVKKYALHNDDDKDRTLPFIDTEALAKMNDWDKIKILTSYIAQKAYKKGVPFDKLLSFSSNELLGKILRACGKGISFEHLNAIPFDFLEPTLDFIESDYLQASFVNEALPVILQEKNQTSDLYEYFISKDAAILCKKTGCSIKEVLDFQDEKVWETLLWNIKWKELDPGKAAEGFKKIKNLEDINILLGIRSKKLQKIIESDKPLKDSLEEHWEPKKKVSSSQTTFMFGSKKGHQVSTGLMQETKSPEKETKPSQKGNKA